MLIQTKYTTGFRQLMLALKVKSPLTLLRLAYFCYFSGIYQCKCVILFQPPDILKTLACRYKPGKLPYVTYKEETLSWSPKISMFYDVISDDKSDTVKELARPKVMRYNFEDQETQYKTKPSEHRHTRVYRCIQCIIRILSVLCSQGCIHPKQSWSPLSWDENVTLPITQHEIGSHSATLNVSSWMCGIVI